MGVTASHIGSCLAVIAGSWSRPEYLTLGTTDLGLSYRHVKIFAGTGQTAAITLASFITPESLFLPEFFSDHVCCPHSSGPEISNQYVSRVLHLPGPSLLLHLNREENRVPGRPSMSGRGRLEKPHRWSSETSSLLVSSGVC